MVYNYGINGLGQRVSKASTAITTGKQLYNYDDAGHLIGEYNTSGARLAEHIYLGDLPVAVINSTGTVFHVLSDHLGTPRQIINATKQLRWQWDNTEPFGANTANQNPSALGAFTYNLRFAGQYFDAETGLHYNNFRDYDPKTGRYIESDPIGLKGGINTYAYVGGNPISNIDPMGENVITAGRAGWTIGSAVNTAIEIGLGVPLGVAIYDAVDSIYAMASQQKGENEYTRKARTEAHGTNKDPCDFIAEWLYQAKLARDTKKVEKLVEAEKFLGCRNKKKRKECN